jgi:peroxiredoxin
MDVMTIKLGDTLPDLKITLATPQGPEETTTSALFGGRRAVLFAVPGAFTPTCSERHLPGFIALADQFAAKGIDPVVCLAVNDVFVMSAWAKQSGAEGKITMLADGSGLLTKALGLELDLAARGLGVRAQRFAMLLDDAKVVHLAVEPAGGYGVTSAEQLLAEV